MENGQSVGACTYHSLICGGGTGLFLRYNLILVMASGNNGYVETKIVHTFVFRVRENQILMLHGSNKGCFGASPYVDAYGEPDPFLR